MKTVKFVSADRSFASAVRKNVNAYFKENNISPRGNASLVLKTAVMFALYLTPFILLFTLPVVNWMIFPMAVIMGIGMAGIGMGVMHDAAHGATSGKRWVNGILGRSMHLLGSSVFTWKVQHNIKHHTFTNIEGHDEDMETKTIIRLSKHRPLKKIYRFQHIYAFFLYTLLTFSKMLGDFRQLRRYNREGITKDQKSTPLKETVRMIAYKIIYLAVILGLPMVLTGYSWWLILLGFLVMHLTAGLIMAVVFQLAHLVEEVNQPLPDDKGVIENDWMVHELQTTANFAPQNRLLSWFIGGLNYQIEHHLFPHICHIHYHRLSPIVQKTAQEFGLSYTVMPTVGKAIGSHARFLRSLGR